MSPLLPIESFRNTIGYHPYHFWGLSNATVPVTSACNDIVHKYSWQSDGSVGRNDIQSAIETAEARLLEILGYAPAPHYASQTLAFPRYLDKRLDNMSNRGSDGRWLTVRLKEGHTQEVGVETLTLIEDSTVSFSDSDGDGVNDTFTLTTIATTTETDKSKIAVYFKAADRLDSDSVGDSWRILPVKVTINGNGTVTVKGKSWLLVKPIEYEGVDVVGLDPATMTKFVTSLEVYRRWTNGGGNTTATSQAVLTWETFPYPHWAYPCCDAAIYSDGTTDPASIADSIARCGIRDSTLGIVNPAKAVYDSSSGLWNAVSWGVAKPPDKVTVRYLSGWPLVNGEMDRKWQIVVARLAAAELAGKICACDTANRELYRWQFDLARSAGVNDEQYSISQNDLDNPLGTRAGQVAAWKVAKNERILIGVLA